MNGELFEIMVIRLSHTPSDLSTENSIKLSLTLEVIFLDHGLIIESIFIYLDHGLLFRWILTSRISGKRYTLLRCTCICCTFLCMYLHSMAYNTVVSKI